MKRFYVEYGSDHGWAIQCSHDLIEAENFNEAMKSWTTKVRGKVVYTRLPPEALFELPTFMADWPRDQVLAHYRDKSFTNQFVAPENETVVHAVVRKTRTWHDLWVAARDRLSLRWGN